MRRHSKMQIEIFWNSRKPDAVRSERGKAESSSEEGGNAGAKARHLILALTQRTPPLAHGYRADSSHVMTLSGSVRRSGMAANPRMVQRSPPPVKPARSRTALLSNDDAGEGEEEGGGERAWGEAPEVV